MYSAVFVFNFVMGGGGIHVTIVQDSLGLTVRTGPLPHIGTHLKLHLKRHYSEKPGGSLRSCLTMMSNTL